MERQIIHTAKILAEFGGRTSCGEIRRILHQALTPEQRERVLAQEERWEAFQQAEWERPLHPDETQAMSEAMRAAEADWDPQPLCLGGDEW